MAGQLITGRIVTPDGVLDDGWLHIDGGKIKAVGTDQAPATERTTRADWVVPGFIDIHCHGGGGAAFTSPNPDDIRTATAFHARHGTTTLLASLVSRPIPELVEQLAILREHVTDGVIAGVHLEGPFLAEARCGAHDPAILTPPDRDSVAALLDTGQVRMVTLAPELDGAIDAVKQLVDGGSIAAIGHTDAVESLVLPAIDAGATVATHLFNGMRPLHHREPGPIGALLDDERVSVELICDLVHLSPTIVRMAAQHAGTNRTVLVTDAISATGAGDGQYQLGGLTIEVRDGVPTVQGSNSLAGSTLTMDAAFRNLITACGLDITAAVAATAARPADLLGLDTGRLAAGKSADVVLLDDKLQVERVLQRGNWIA
ncbi:N-acetylglucosamine-6-phosphate deacetylase [Alloactinosynnema sp. L-07]|uniref:N-acetylglucosamine-6-phosphate deacetylase n=1 Tax=Alloactinosynnema sp. L-07 TaxID=1653480 RepID=UPI00065EFDAC|nr:N-acetylglucosamine-6-phosphate deacetylase [Alloactinosynnema sp. L-07]CRK60494.1 N-acetylglucosamine-6-phosphate deacetylase [Alloactinosynnema sp. L-07]